MQTDHLTKVHFLSDSDEEAIVEFVKQHEELYDKTNDEVTSEGREFPSLLHSSHPRGLLQPQLQFQIHPRTQNLRWKSALHQMLLISL